MTPAPTRRGGPVVRRRAADACGCSRPAGAARYPAVGRTVAGIGARGRGRVVRTVSAAAGGGHDLTDRRSNGRSRDCHCRSWLCARRRPCGGAGPRCGVAWCLAGRCLPGCPSGSGELMDLVIRDACILEGRELRTVDIGLQGAAIAAISPALAVDAPELKAAGCLVISGLIETHIHLDKTCILDRCRIEEGTVAEAVRETAAAKRNFTVEDVYARGKRTLERCIVGGTMRMRTHVELDPGIAMIGFEAVEELARDYAWALDVELCVFPQEGLTNNPGTEELLIEGLRRGARAIGAVPYFDSDPRGQIDRIFAIARDFDVEVDMHLALTKPAARIRIESASR